jgi:hypothetical protein
MTALAFQAGAWVGGPGQYPQPTQENVQAFQDLQGSHVDLISHFALFDMNDWDNVRQYADVAKQNGSTLVVTWMANGYVAQDIVDGRTDNYVREFAKGIKAYGEEIWLRPLHEANGNWYDWGVGKADVGNTDENVAEAYRHIVKIFREENVENVKWVWTTNASNEGRGTTFTGTYPGDDYVDYISIDGYNWGKSQDWSRWQTFSQVFKKAYDALANIDKPLFIAEISCSEKGGSKAEWITDMFEHFRTDFSRVFAVMWFSQSKETEGDWALNTSTEAVEAWKAGLAMMRENAGTTSLRQTGTVPQNAFRIHDGTLYVQTDKTVKAKVVQLDQQGRILWQGPVQQFTPGEHAINVPDTNARSIYKLVVQR